MKVSYDEIGYQAATFVHESGQVGGVCKVGVTGTIVNCDENDDFCGVIQRVRGGYAAVQLHGFATVRYVGNTPDCGYIGLLADGQGGVYINGSGRKRLVVSVDEEAQTCVLEL